MKLQNKIFNILKNKKIKYNNKYGSNHLNINLININRYKFKNIKKIYTYKY